MKKNQRKSWLHPVILGVCCAALSGLAAWYDLTCNGGRLVYPMNSYAFQPTDIPMIAALVLDVVYGLYLLVLLIRGITSQKRQMLKTGRTRRISPKLGLLGILGFFGFTGFWSYSALGDLAPFCFFTFFGFFFEGKMSNILMDERYKENAARAELTAYRIGFTLIFLLLIFAGQANRFSAKIVAPVLIAGISLAVALTLFLSEYLLYHYDQDGMADSDGEEL